MQQLRTALVELNNRKGSICHEKEVRWWNEEDLKAVRGKKLVFKQHQKSTL